MSQNQRQRSDGLLVLAVARGETLATAAQLSGVSQRTVNRRLMLPEFRREVQQARSQLVDAAAGKISNTLDAAAECLKSLLGSEHSDAIRLSAARALFEIGIRLKEVVELERRLQAVEDRLNVQPATTTLAG
ncbi:MAG: hypothetical protein ACKV2Q_28105 [Planctomycetaceae bacterium]